VKQNQSDKVFLLWALPKKETLSFAALTLGRFHDFCARSELGEVGLLLVKSPV
jgi:hypothetical protein